MWDAPFEYRLAALALFLSLASGIELAFRGRESVRWRASILIIGLGGVGALIGLSLDLCTSTISPAYFAVGKGLGWGDGLTLRACGLGLQAGASAGVVAGAVLAYINYRSGLPSLPLARVIWLARFPVAAAVSCGALLCASTALNPPGVLLDVARPRLQAGQEHAFVVVWATHAGVYFGAIVGLILAAFRLWRGSPVRVAPASPRHGTRRADRSSSR